MSRTSKYYQHKIVISRQVTCLWCGAELVHKAAGRPRRFCSTACRMAYHRAVKQHLDACVEATLTGRPKPPANYGKPSSHARYEIDEAGNVTKLARPERRG